MTNNQLIDERVTSVIKRLEHYACNLKWTDVRGAQDLLTAADGLRELQERRKAAAEPAAYLVCNGRLYQDRPFLSLSAARISVNDRNDGAEIKALCVSGALAEKAK